MLEETNSKIENISYYEEDSKDTTLGNQSNIPIIKNNNLNKLKRKKDYNQVITLQKKKRGRKSKNKNQANRIHNKYKRDNIVSRIKVKYHKFIIKKLNLKLNELNINESFEEFAGFFQRDITISSNYKLMNLKISDILVKIECSRNQGFLNKIIYEKVCNFKEMKILLSKTYKEFYEEYFMKSKEVKSFIRNEGDYVNPVLDSLFNNFKNKPKNQKKKSKLYDTLFSNELKYNRILSNK